MDLQDIFKAWRAGHADDDPVTALLDDIQQMDGRRSENLYRLIEKANQVERKIGHGSRTEGELRKWLDGFRRDLQAAAIERRDQFGPNLAEALAPLGMKLRGQYPRLNAGFFLFELNFDKGRCHIWYGPEQEKVTETVLEAGKVAELTRLARSRLGSGFDVPDVLTRLRRAHQFARFEHPTAPMPLLALLPYMALLIQGDRFRADPRKENYHEYTRADYSYDLYRSRDAISKHFRLTTATRQQTAHRSDFLWIPSREDVEDGSYVATVDVKEG